MIPRFLFLLACLGVVSGRAAEEAILTLLAPSQAVVAGQSASIDVIGLNATSNDINFSIESTLPATLKVGTSAWPVNLQATSNAAAAIAPGGFTARRYRFDVPAAAAGTAILEVSRGTSSPLIAALAVAVGPGPHAPAVTPAAAPAAVDRLATFAPASSTLSRTFAGRFMPNMPVYFLYGDADQAAKFQFSFDYRLATLPFPGETEGSLTSLRIGYTQRSVWDINAFSSPFYDTSYMPEIVINTEAPMPKDNTGWFTWLGLRGGFLHESNGKDGDASRSLNIAYLRPRFVLGRFDSWLFVMLPEIHGYLGDIENNPRLRDYRGYGKLRFYAGRGSGAALMVSLWGGHEFDHGTYQLDLTTPFRTRLLNVESYFQLQYFHGYGESLRGYDERTEALRIGLALVR